MWPLVWTALVLLLVWISTRPRARQGCRLPPGSYGWPIIGETVPFLLNGREYMLSRLKKYGPVFKTNILGSPTVVVSGADNVRQILLNHGDCFAMTCQPSSGVLLGPNTVTMMTGQQHVIMHKTMLRAISGGVLELTPAVHGVVAEFLDTWRSMGALSSGVREVRALSFTVTTRILMGVEFDHKERQHFLDLFDTFIEAFFSFPINLPGFKFRQGLNARRELRDILQAKFTEAALADSRAVFQDIMRGSSESSYGGEHADGLGKPLVVSERELDVAIELIFGSLEATASALCTLLICLHEQPAVIEQIGQVLRDASLSDAGCPLSYRDVTSLTLVNNTVREVLRLTPPVAGAFRRTVKSADIMGYHVPAGWTVLYSIAGTHYITEQFTAKKDFNPDRWISPSQTPEGLAPGRSSLGGQRRPARLGYEYIPFGGGKRSCVGRKFAETLLKVTTIELVRTVRWTLPNGRPLLYTDPTPFPQDNLPIVFESLPTTSSV